MITEPVSFADEERTESVGSQIRTLPVTKTDVLQAYTRAVNEVKLRSPGFTLLQRENYRDVTANSDTVLLQWNAFLSSAIQNGTTTVSPDADVDCRTFFPVCDTDYGCRLTDASLLQKAVCRESGSVRTLELSFRNIEDDEDAFSQMRQCFCLHDGKTVLHMLAQSVPGLREETAELTQKYSYCEIECRTDTETGQMLSLRQKTVCEYLVCANVRIGESDTPFIARASVIRHRQYSDFIWKTTR